MVNAVRPLFLCCDVKEVLTVLPRQYSIEISKRPVKSRTKLAVIKVSLRGNIVDARKLAVIR
jgi:hypothetical protein